MDYMLTVRAGRKTYTILTDDGDPHLVGEGHPRFYEIDQHLTGATVFDPARVIGWINHANTALTEVTRLSPSLTYSRAEGLRFDGRVLDNALTGPLIQAINEGETDYAPQVAFLDKVHRNPDPTAVAGLIKWVAAEQLSITDTGNVIGYKQVQALHDGSGTGPQFGSIHIGPHVSVNGTPVSDTAPVGQNVGDVVTMPRHWVTADPQQGCSAGLHIGTRNYATGFSGDATLVVAFDPADVVSVPDDYHWQKIRVCGYRITGIDIGRLQRRGLITGQRRVAPIDPLSEDLDLITPDPTAPYRQDGNYSGRAFKQALGLRWRKIVKAVNRAQAHVTPTDIIESSFFADDGSEVADYTFTDHGAAEFLRAIRGAGSDAQHALQLVTSYAQPTARAMLSKATAAGTFDPLDWTEVLRQASARVPNGFHRIRSERSDYRLSEAAVAALQDVIARLQYDNDNDDDYGDVDD